MSLSDEQRARLAQAKVTALARNHLDFEGVAGPFRDGAVVRDGDRAAVLIESPGPRVLGGALTWAVRNDVRRLDVLVDTSGPMSGGSGAPEPERILGHLARLAGLVSFPVAVWSVASADAVQRATPAPVPTVADAPDGVETLVALLESPALEGGALEVVLEHGVVRGEVLGLEVARIVEEDPLTGEPSDPRLSVGVGRFDREVGAMMFADLPAAEALARAVRIVRSERFPGAGNHPLALLGRERWIRRMLVADPALVGAAELHPVETTWERPNLKDPHPALAVGARPDGTPVVVAATAGVDLDAPLLAADVRAREHAGAPLVIATSETAAPALYRAVAAHLPGEVEVVSVRGPWAD